MRTISVKVTSNKEIINPDLQVDQYDSVEEAVQELGNGPVLNLVNRMVKIDATNKERMSKADSTQRNAFAKIGAALASGRLSKAEAQAEIDKLLAASDA